MNQRIQQLAEQSGLYDETTPEEVPEFTACFEKFALLIVQECTNVLRQEWFDENNRVSEEGPREVAMRAGGKAALIAAIHKVKEHFGVNNGSV